MEFAESQEMAENISKTYHHFQQSFFIESLGSESLVVSHCKMRPFAIGWFHKPDSTMWQSRDDRIDSIDQHMPTDSNLICAFCSNFGAAPALPYSLIIMFSAHKMFPMDWTDLTVWMFTFFARVELFSRVILARIERAKKVRFCLFIKVSREQIIENFEIVRLTSKFFWPCWIGS